MRHVLFIGLLCISLVLSGCYFCKKHEPVPMPEPVENPTDNAVQQGWTPEHFREAARSLTADLLSASWYQDFSAAETRKPVIMILSVQNLTEEHISAENLSRDLSRELLRSGRVTFVAPREDRPLNPDNPEPTEGIAESTGADFAIKGSIVRTGALGENLRSKLYEVELSLVNLKSGELAHRCSHTVQIQIHR
jgi:TolB-like protein